MSERLTRASFAMKASAIAVVASEWSRDSLHPYRPVDDTMHDEDVRRFCDLIRERLTWMEEDLSAPTDLEAAPESPD